MKKLVLYLLFYTLAFTISGQNAIQLGAGSYAEYPPESVWDEDGYFAKNYRWFKDNWQNLYLHSNVRNRPLPTNKWWTNYVFAQYGGNAWAYPHAVSADKEGIDIKIPSGFQGGNMIITPFLEVKASTSLQSNDEAIVFADFESTSYPAGWTVGPNPAFTGPVALSEITQSPTPNGFTGTRFVNSFRGDAAKLSLTSTPFVISKNYIRLRVGGGNNPDLTYVGLFINGTRVFVEVGANSGNLTQRTWDVSAYVGQTAEIRIVDNSTGGWGFIMCDEIVFSNSTFGGTGYANDFVSKSSNVYDWTDLGFTFRNEDTAGRFMDVTLVHGIPYTWIELNNLVPILKPASAAKIYNASGTEIAAFPVQTDAVTMEFGGRIYGVHLPAGSTLHKSKGEDFQVEIPASSAKYIVVSALPNRSLLSTYDLYARNKPVNTMYEWDYRIAEGKIRTEFKIQTKNLQTNVTGGQTLMSFLPHHYRKTEQNFSFITGADYQVVIGKMKSAAGSNFAIDYKFSGMPPYLPEPMNMTATQKTRLNSLITARANVSAGFNGNTYAKGLGEESNVMLMAKSVNHDKFDVLKNNLKNELVDWLTFDPSETTKKQYFFAKYPDYGAIIGFPPGYGSQGFNDLHFHYGYFTMGAARLMMLDKEFKRDYADMVKLITRSYANTKHYAPGDDYLPFLRTFDPYMGHSWAGGTGDGGGNNQESTSEAIHSWFGVYLLGVELNDPEITKLGAMGYLLESTTANEYWMDMYEDNFPSTYNREYVGILRTDNLGWGTYFSGDPAWILGIQAVPCDFFYQFLGNEKGRMKSIWEAMIVDRTKQMYDPDGDGPLGPQPMSNTTDAFENILGMGSYLGGYHLNIMNTYDPEKAALFTDSLYAKGGAWATDANMATNYYVSNAILTYGVPAEGYHTSIASGAVYKNAQGEITYLLYNPTESDINVDIYKDGIVIETIKVGARKYYNSKFVGSLKPAVTFTSHKAGDKLALNGKVKLTVSASDKDGVVQSVDFYAGKTFLGTSLIEPFEVTYTPTVSGMTELIAIATDNDGNRSDSCKIQVQVLTVAQTPYINRPWNIPADKILAVQFDNGGPGISCQDNEIAIQGGNNLRADTGVETENSNGSDGNIGYTNAGEWYEYTVDVQTAGVYSLSMRMSSAGGGAIHFEFDGENKTGSININKTGSWGAYKDTIVAQVPLKAGVQVMRVAIDRAGINLSSYKFTLTAAKMPPVANAGADRIVELPLTSVQLTGSATAFTGSAITGYEWKQTDSNAHVQIQNPNSATTTVSGLKAGTYVFELKATDNEGLSATDKMVVLVKPANFAPIANPGNSRSINVSEQEIMLDGSNSTDPDGTIVKYEWEQIDSHNRLTLSQTSVTNPVARISGFEAGRLYIFRLTVTDNRGASSSENVRILVETTTSVNGPAHQQIAVYPNPFTNKLMVVTDKNAGFKRLLLHTVTGNVLIDKNISNIPVVHLNTSELQSGYYILTLISDHQVVSRKVIK